MENSTDSTGIEILQPKARVITLSYSDSEIGEVRSILDQLQRTHGYTSDSMKGLFLKILRKSVEIPVVTEDSTTQISIEDSNEFKALQEKLKMCERLNFIANERVKDLEISVNELKSENELLANVEVDNEPIPLTANQILLELSDDELTLLNQIAENRHAKGYDDNLETITTIAKRIIFNRGMLYNWGGEFYTGL